MRVRSIHHSGFLLETEAGSYIFDYYRGEVPPLDPLKPVTVLVSHGHKDHYNPDIFAILRAQGVRDVFAVLAKDIPKSRYPADTETLTAHANSVYTLPHGERLETLRSTDQGVAFLLTTAEGDVYHAGDLNDWTWEGEPEADNKAMRGNYRHEIDKLHGRRLQVAFVPLDPRQEAHYADGLLYFLSQVEAERVYPMHTWGDPSVIRRFVTEYPEYRGIIQYETNTEKEKQP